MMNKSTYEIDETVPEEALREMLESQLEEFEAYIEGRMACEVDE